MSFHRLASLGLVGTVIVTAGSPPHRGLPVVQPNPNTTRAGQLRSGVLTVALEARASLFHINGPDHPAMTIEAFAEPDHPERVAPLAFEHVAHTNDSVPTMHFVVEEHGRRIDTHRDASPELDLVQGEPVAITIVNHLPEATSVHWHGMEVQDSYMDGVPGFSGDGERLTPAIAPGDSFVARFTPPRAGTFMYHAHIDEIREDLAGLDGPLVVRKPGQLRSGDDFTFFFKQQGPASRRPPPPEINGQTQPDTVTLHVGRPARLRILNLSTATFAPIFVLTSVRDGAASLPANDMLERWRLTAKDGFDVPTGGSLVAARQVVSIGETYDFVYTPRARGSFQLQVWRVEMPELPIPAKLQITVPIRVE